MFEQDRSLDDLPLAAYSRGTIEELPDAEVDPPPADPPTDAPATAPSGVGVRPTSPAGQVVAGTPDGVERPPQRVELVLPSGPALALPANVPAVLRDPRTLAGGAVVVGIAILVMTLGGGLPSGATAPSPTATPAATAFVQPAGAVTLTLSGGLTGTYTLTGSTGLGRPTDDRLEASWTDAAGSVLTLTGVATSGTRPTGADLALSWTVMVNGKPVTFTSNRGECVLGMALKPRTISGSITCMKLHSDDGKLVVGIAGDYRT